MRFGCITLATGLALVSLAGCNNVQIPTPNLPQGNFPRIDPLPEQPTEVKVGLLLPLSGPAAAVGQDMLKAAQMALFDAGENDIVLLPRDSRGTAEGASEAASSLIEEGAEVLVGPLYSAAVEAVTPLAQAAGIRVLAFSNVSEVADNGTYILGYRPEEQVERVVEYALSQGKYRIAGLAPDDAYGATVIAALQRAVIRGGGELAETLFYPPDLADPSSVVSDVADYKERQEALEEEKAKLEGRQDEISKRALARLETLDTFGDPPFDAILLADGGDRLRSVASLLTFYDVDPGKVKFLGTIRWQDDPRILAEDALRGGWFAATSPATLDAFKSRFQSVFEKTPEPLAALAYDATALVIIVSRDLNDRRFDPFSLTGSEGFTGATGLFRLQVDGRAQHGLAILEVDRGAVREIVPPPTRFVDDLVDRWTYPDGEAGAPVVAPPTAPEEWQPSYTPLPGGS